MKTCPQCAEQVQDAAEVCRYCGHKFDAFARANDALKSIGCGTAFLIFVAIAITWNALSGSGSQENSTATQAPAIQDVAACNSLLKKARSDGLIRGRPSADTAEVDELLWAELPANSKKGIALALRCSAYGGAPGQLDGAEVDGFHTGKRLAFASSVGVTFD